MTLVTEVADAIVGIDTHRDTHDLQLIKPTGQLVADLHVPNSDAGFASVIDWLAEYAPGQRVIAGVEGTRSYGIGLARALSSAGIVVVEVDPAGALRRGRGKSDAIDARHAALAVLAMDATKLPVPRADGDREALRILLIARAEMVSARTAQGNRLHALLLAGDDRDRDAARGKFTDTRLVALCRRRLAPNVTREQRIRHGEIRRLATALRLLHDDLRANRASLLEVVNELIPALLERRGIGPVSAAQALVSYSHTGRVRSEAAFARLAGTCPIPASSGRTTRHRLNRGGDRALNRAVYTIAVTRMRCCERTRAYVARRRTEGRTTAEICRCLKRYITCELYRALNAAEVGPGSASVEELDHSSVDGRRVLLR